MYEPTSSPSGYSFPCIHHDAPHHGSFSCLRRVLTLGHPAAVHPRRYLHRVGRPRPLAKRPLTPVVFARSFCEPSRVVASRTITRHLTPSPGISHHHLTGHLTSSSLSLSLSRIRLAYHTHHRTPLTRVASHIVGSRSLGRSGFPPHRDSSCIVPPSSVWIPPSHLLQELLPVASRQRWSLFPFRPPALSSLPSTHTSSTFPHNCST